MMWTVASDFEFEDIKSFDYNELNKIKPYITKRQFKMLTEFIIPDINALLEDCAEEARKHRVEEICTYMYYCKYPWVIDKEEDKMFYTASIMSYLIYKGFEIVGRIFERDYFCFKIQW